jgi:hypothetical protein
LRFFTREKSNEETSESNSAAVQQQHALLSPCSYIQSCGFVDCFRWGCEQSSMVMSEECPRSGTTSERLAWCVSCTTTGWCGQQHAVYALANFAYFRFHTC